MSRWKGWYDEARVEIKSRLDCRDLARAYGLEKARGTNKVSGRCPFHEDASPSFTAHRDGWSCLAGCGYGDAFDMIALATGLTGEPLMVHAADLAAWDWDGARAAWCVRMGMKEPTKTLRAPAPALPPRKPDEPTAEEVLWASRGLDAATVRLTARKALADVVESKAGAFTEAGLAWIAARGLDPELCKWARMSCVNSARMSGWVTDQPNHEFWGFSTTHGGILPWWDEALLVPYCDAVGDLECLRFRRIDDSSGPKMVSQRTVVRDLDWSPTLPYLGWIAPREAAARRLPLWVVEGEWDALALLMADRLAVGSPGAAAWREQWVEGWQDLPRVVVCHDNDAAGLKWARCVFEAALKAHGIKWATARVKIVTTQDVKDVGDMLRASGRDALAAWCHAQEV